MKNSRILIVTQFYAPEPCAAAHRVEAFARALARRGNAVRVLCPLPSFPSGTIDARYAGKWVSQERDGAIEIIRVRHIASAGRGGRLLAWASFAVLASCYVLFAPAFDIIGMSTPPISVGIPAWIGAVARRARLIVDVRDVFPDLPIQMGLWREKGLMARAVGAFARALYRRASVVSVVTQTALERVRRREPSAPIVLAPNAGDPVAPQAPGALQGGRFVAAFTGNMGLANGLDVLLDAAKRVAGEGIVVRLVGGGADLSRVRARIRNESIHNVQLLGVLPREQAVGVLAESDACIVILRKGIEESVPTKLFDAFAVGCPVILSAAGEARRVVESSGGGICCAAGDALALADGLRALADNPALRERLAVAGRAFARQWGDRTRVMDALAISVQRAVAAAASS